MCSSLYNLPVFHDNNYLASVIVERSVRNHQNGFPAITFAIASLN